jgi:hypothetical protein
MSMNRISLVFNALNALYSTHRLATECVLITTKDPSNHVYLLKVALRTYLAIARSTEENTRLLSCWAEFFPCSLDRDIPDLSYFDGENT